MGTRRAGSSAGWLLSRPRCVGRVADRLRCGLRHAQPTLTCTCPGPHLLRHKRPQLRRVLLHVHPHDRQAPPPVLARQLGKVREGHAAGPAPATGRQGEGRECGSARRATRPGPHLRAASSAARRGARSGAAPARNNGASGLPRSRLQRSTDGPPDAAIPGTTTFLPATLALSAGGWPNTRRPCKVARGTLLSPRPRTTAAASPGGPKLEHHWTALAGDGCGVPLDKGQPRCGAGARGTAVRS